jgi:hypothetical protein
MQTGVPALDKAVKRLMELDQESVFALADIAEERVRQIESEGWTPEHDDQHAHGEMVAAAGCYAIAAYAPLGENCSYWDETSKIANAVRALWPWDWKWWKPKSRHRNQVKAGALLVAELARWLRTAPSTSTPNR